MKKYKIVATTWQIMHWWDLFNALKDHADFYLITNNHRDWRKKEFLAARSIPENVTFVPYYEKGKYDFAILNVDQQVCNTRLGKARLVAELNSEIQDIPKVFINHASPVYPELFAVAGVTFEEAEQMCRDAIKSIIGDNKMITNSYKAASKDEWGWGYPIWHGLDAKEWLDLEKEPRVFSALSARGCDEYYNRECMNRVVNDFEKMYGHKVWWAKQTITTEKSPEDYKTFMGKSLIYLDVSFRTPMNRARAEAMLSGCCIVQVKGAHDLERFAKDGENMVLVENSPKAICELLFDLVENRYDECIAIGQAGKKTAMELFNRDRYRDDWLNFIHNELKI